MPQVSSVTVPYATYLRVYEPLAAFPEPERGHWERYAKRAELPTCQDELRRSLAALLPTPPMAVPVHESEDAFVAEMDGVLCVCPWRTRLRGWQSLGELAGQWPTPVLDAVLPPVVREQAAADYEKWLADHPDARPWIRTATWQVPLSWFALFADEEREFAGVREPEGAREAGAEPGAGEGSGPRPAVLRYRTPMVQARRRVARAFKTLKDNVDEGPLLDSLIEVGRWLEEFHPRSLVELDYGGLVHALPAQELDADHSAADVTEGITALRSGEGARAAEAYRRLVERWRSVRERQLAN